MKRISQPFKMNLKRTVSIINNQYKNLQSLREKKPIVMLQRVQPSELQNTSNMKFKKYVTDSVDSNPHLKNLRRRISIQDNMMQISLNNRRRSSSISSSSRSIGKLDKINDDLNFKFDENFKKRIFPEWLESQEEFKNLKERKGNISSNNIFEICRKRVVERNDIEIGHTFDYLKSRVSYLSLNYSREIIQQIAAKIISKFFQTGTTIYERNSKGEEMFIIYNGLVGLYAGGEMMAKVGYNGVFSEKVIENSQIRNYKAVALTDCELLSLKLEDMKKILTNMSVQIIQENRKCLSESSIFKHWDSMKKERLCHIVEERKIAKGK
jgi:CRP-like cAMP-binding protein